MNSRIMLYRKFVLSIVVFTLLAGCASIPKSVSNEFSGVWKLQEAYTTDYTTANNYLVIYADDTAEIWTDKGLTILAVLEVDNEGLMHWVNTQTPEDPSRDGSGFIVEFDRNGDLLSGVYYPEDNSWRWEPVFDRVSALPLFTYSNNFEDNTLKYINSQEQEGSEAEWQIIDEPGNFGNKILSPLYADENSDAEIFIHPGKNFSIEFDMKQTKSIDSNESCWMALDFLTYTRPGDNYTPFWLNSDSPGSFSSGDRGDIYSELTYSTGMEWDNWYTLKVTVREGKYFQFFLDGVLFGEREVEETLFTGFKIEGNPDTGIWYMDNLNISWNEVD
ncbi:MAG: hypothetical protein KAR21_02090 [Spirochaetales bacterium]|nr:hypothetical protein [Spirochaetales bacterium]